MIAQGNPSRTVAQSRQAARRTSPTANQRPAWHERFLHLLPDIIRHARVRLRGLAPAAREEALDDVLAHALVAYARLVELGKEEIAYATPLARNAVAQYRVGRRVGMPVNCHDILSQACRRRNGLTIERLDRFDRHSGTWEEVVVEDRRFTPADAAATRIDFRAWLASLTRRDRQLAERLATGESTSGVARFFGLTPGRVSQLRRALFHKWHLFQGELSPAHA